MDLVVFFFFFFFFQCFHDLAYNAITGEELLDGLDQFLEDSIVLPPGDWDQDLLLPLMHERNELRRKRGVFMINIVNLMRVNA